MNIDEARIDPVIVTSVGRSGSTLLQRLLNLHEDLTIWGEHGAFLRGILQAHTLGCRNPAHRAHLERGFTHRDTIVGALKEFDTFEPWVSPFDSEVLEHVLRQTIAMLFSEGLAPSTRWGFKEIRYLADDIDQLMGLFPDATLVVLIRDIDTYLFSKFFAFGSAYDLETSAGRQTARGHLQAFINQWINLYGGILQGWDGYRERVIVTRYEGITSQAGVEEVFDLLDLQPPEKSAIQQVLKERTGTSQKSSTVRDRAKLEELTAELDLDRSVVDEISSGLTLSTA